MDKDFDRIVGNRGTLGGRPRIAGTRISVEFVLELLASGSGVAEIVRAYPQLDEDGVRQAILYAAEGMRHELLFRRNSDGTRPTDEG